MGQSSLGKPRSLDSEIVIVIADESMEEINVGVEPEVEEQEDGAQPAQTDEGQDDANVEAIIDDDNLMEIDETVDEYGEKVDFAEEYLSISNDIAHQPPAICLNTEEIGKTFDELFGYISFQHREILDDYLSLSFTDMKAKVDEYFTPFAKRQFFCPTIIDAVTKLPRASTKDEYMTWASRAGRENYQSIRNEWMSQKYFTTSDSSLLACENLDICYEVIKIHELMWNIFLWAYTAMNVNELLTPFIAVNNDGFRKVRPNHKEMVNEV